MSEYSKKAMGVAVTLTVTAMLTSSGAMLKFVYDGAKTAESNRDELIAHQEWMLSQTKTINLLTRNQRLIICEMKAEQGGACKPTDLLTTPNGD